MKINQAFWDTSAIVPLCCFQPKSQTLRELRRKYEVVAWWASVIEAHSALKRLVSQNVISQNAYLESVRRLEIQKDTWREILPTEKVRTIAKSLIETENRGCKEFCVIQKRGGELHNADQKRNT